MADTTRATTSAHRFVWLMCFFYPVIGILVMLAAGREPAFTWVGISIGVIGILAGLFGNRLRSLEMRINELEARQADKE